MLELCIAGGGGGGGGENKDRIRCSVKCIEAVQSTFEGIVESLHTLLPSFWTEQPFKRIRSGVAYVAPQSEKPTTGRGSSNGWLPSIKLSPLALTTLRWPHFDIPDSRMPNRPAVDR